MILGEWVDLYDLPFLCLCYYTLFVHVHWVAFELMILFPGWWDENAGFHLWTLLPIRVNIKLNLYYNCLKIYSVHEDQQY